MLGHIAASSRGVDVRTGDIAATADTILQQAAIPLRAISGFHKCYIRVSIRALEGFYKGTRRVLWARAPCMCLYLCVCVYIYIYIYIYIYTLIIYNIYIYTYLSLKVRM